VIANNADYNGVNVLLSFCRFTFKTAPIPTTPRAERFLQRNKKQEVIEATTNTAIVDTATVDTALDITAADVTNPQTILTEPPNETFHYMVSVNTVYIFRVSSVLCSVLCYMFTFYS